jgi:hypothetical protein
MQPSCRTKRLSLYLFSSKRFRVGASDNQATLRLLGAVNLITQVNQPDLSRFERDRRNQRTDR